MPFFILIGEENPDSDRLSLRVDFALYNFRGFVMDDVGL
jgi:hypothetical protein